MMPAQWCSVTIFSMVDGLEKTCPMQYIMQKTDTPLFLATMSRILSGLAEQIVPSARGELEITTLNDMYLKQKKLKAQILGRGFAWLDTGTMDSLMEASTFVQTVQNRQDMVISAPEEIAYHGKWITKEKLLESAEAYGKSPYGEHLKRVAEDKIIF